MAQKNLRTFAKARTQAKKPPANYGRKGRLQGWGRPEPMKTD